MEVIKAIEHQLEADGRGRYFNADDPGDLSNPQDILACSADIPFDTLVTEIESVALASWVVVELTADHFQKWVQKCRDWDSKSRLPIIRFGFEIECDSVVCEIDLKYDPIGFE